MPEDGSKQASTLVKSENSSVENSLIGTFVGQRTCRLKRNCQSKNSMKIFVGWKFAGRKICLSKIRPSKNLSIKKFVKKFVCKKLGLLKNLSKYTIGTKNNSDTKELRCGKKPAWIWVLRRSACQQVDDEFKKTPFCKRADFIYRAPHIFYVPLYFQLSVSLKVLWHLLFIFLPNPYIFKSRYLWIAPHK